MKVNIMPCRYPLNPNEWPMRLAEGVRACGDEPRFSQNPDGSDVHVFWGLRRAWGRRALAAKKPSLIIERGYLGDRLREWYALGWNGLNGAADFVNDDVPPDRWETLWRPQMQPWRDGGDYALVIGQVPGDMALRGLGIYSWAERVALEARRRFGKVYFRPHPQDKRARDIQACPTMPGSLAEAFEGAEVVITYNSNTAVDAVMAGIPAVACGPGSMAHAVTSRGISAPLFTGDREDWGRRIAYAQWNPTEIRDGTAWRHVTRKMRHGR